MRLFEKKKRPYWPDEFSLLAEYNAEVGRGIVHTSEWDKLMKAVQERFNQRAIRECEEKHYG
jgi:hypothetical protein